MKILVSTLVNQPIEQVWKGFDQSLFLKLAPPFPPVKLLRFDGCKRGDYVSLELNFLIFKQKWTSEITADEQSTQRIFFVDEGRELPFFLSKWKHTHTLKHSSGGTQIIDDIHYSTPLGWLGDVLVFPILYLQFLYRKPIYKKIFG
jgi:ligand-binding SRPBCC domain-containing protein